MCIRFTVLVFALQIEYLLEFSLILNHTQSHVSVVFIGGREAQISRLSLAFERLLLDAQNAFYAGEHS